MQNIKNGIKYGYSSSIRYESIVIFDFKQIPPCPQPIIIVTSKIQEWLFLKY